MHRRARCAACLIIVDFVILLIIIEVQILMQYSAVSFLTSVVSF